MQVLDITKFLEDSAMQVILGEKTYIVKDVPFEVIEKASGASTEAEIKSFVSSLLGCPIEDLSELGFKALTHLISEVLKNFTKDSSQLLQ